MSKNIYFWVITALFLIMVVGLAWKVIPPLLATMKTNQDTITQLEQEVAKEEQFSSVLKSLQKEEDSLTGYYAQAKTALPEKADGEQLLLQLDGLLAQAGVPSANLTVPVATAAASPASAASGEAAATTANELTVTINGTIDYNQAKDILSRLKTFIRWNKLSSFDISKSGTAYTASITLKAAFKPSVPKLFSGNSQLLEQSASLFGSFQQYATAPDFKTEGTYGRTNPFERP